MTKPTFSSWLIMGLGNPSRSYEFTRHNAGFLAIDKLARKLDISFSYNKRINISIAKLVDSKASDIILLKSHDFMNSSGVALSQVLADASLSRERLIVVHDDMDVKFGALKLTVSASGAGHNGINNIIQKLNSREFIRVRVGIGHPPSGYSGFDWVLDRFSKDQKKDLACVTEHACDAVLSVIQKGFTATQQIYNNKRFWDEE